MYKLGVGKKERRKKDISGVGKKERRIYQV